MGNEFSTTTAPIDNGVLIPDPNTVSLDNPDVDKRINCGTTAPNCQPKHTREELKRVSVTQNNEDKDELDSNIDDDDDSDNPNNITDVTEDRSGTGLEVVHDATDGKNRVYLPNDGSNAPISPDKRRLKSSSAGGGVHSSSNGVSHKSGHSDAAPEKKTQQQSGSAAESASKMGYIQMARLGYQELVNAIIRPPRADYKEESLGPPAFLFCGRRFTRTDFALKTKRGLNLQCSHWEPVERANDRIPVVIYMHGNSSARVEVLPQLSYLLSLGVAVFSFDFAGSGKSDGDYVSLGYYEREDLMCVIAHLRATKVVSTIALWGRSMGAATALMHGDRDPSIACMILDSPFADLTQLAEEMVDKGREQGIHVPNLVATVVIRMIRSSVKKQANFDIRHISPIAHADKCFIPALFVAGEHDDFIHKHHSEMIHEKYAGDKNMIVVEGDHNSPRPKFMFDSASIFLQTCLQIPSSWALKVHPGMNLMAPPWFYPGHSPAFRSSSNLPASGHGQNSATYAQQRRTQNSSANNTSSHQNRSSTSTASPATNGFDSDKMGMTAERQKEIQASLFKMLGQRDDDPDEGGPTNSSTTTTTRDRSSSKA